jgi:hypothetical protein
VVGAEGNMGAEDDDVGRILLLNRVADEISARFRRGERALLQEYLERHPELADELRELFPALAQAEPAAGGETPPLPDGSDRAWLPAAATADGYLDLRGCVPADAGCDYAVSRVWSPGEQRVSARLEASGAVRFWLNGHLIHETAQGHSPGQSDEMGLTLPAGWSTLAFRVAAGATGRGSPAGPQWWTTAPEARAAASGTGPGLRVWLSGAAERAAGLPKASK